LALNATDVLNVALAVTVADALPVQENWAAATARLAGPWEALSVASIEPCGIASSNDAGSVETTV
jgi:hypothetical protein